MNQSCNEVIKSQNKKGLIFGAKPQKSQKPCSYWIRAKFGPLRKTTFHQKNVEDCSHLSLRAMYLSNRTAAKVWKAPHRSNESSRLSINVHVSRNDLKLKLNMQMNDKLHQQSAHFHLCSKVLKLTTNLFTGSKQDLWNGWTCLPHCSNITFPHSTTHKVFLWILSVSPCLLYQCITCYKWIHLFKVNVLSKVPVTKSEKIAWSIKFSLWLPGNQMTKCNCCSLPPYH